jgi:hypothetical protein
MEIMEKPQPREAATEAKVLMRGTGAELLANADKWKDCRNLELIEVLPHQADAQQEDIFTRLEKRGVVWKDGVPLFPVKEGYVAPTLEQVKAWMDDEDQ